MRRSSVETQYLAERAHCRLAGAVLSAIFAIHVLTSSAHAQRTLYTEDFESLELGMNVDEGLGNDDPQPNVWSPTGPLGWGVDRSGTPAGGVTEFRGWNFVDPTWWASVAEDQERSNFAFGRGFVTAVADGDEWDDAVHPPGTMNTFLITPAWDIQAGEALFFDSSWRPFGNQTATIDAIFDVGDPLEILRWESDVASPNYKPDANPENFVQASFTPPAGATTVQFRFGYTQASDDWWWAVDNIEYGTIFEGFEGVALGENVFEGRDRPQDNVWTRTPPPDWILDDTGVPGHDSPDNDGDGLPDNDGVTEWAGWAFANKSFWISAGGMERSEFALGAGTVAVADPDEWEDKDHPAWADAGYYNAFMETGEISIAGEGANSLEVVFDSSWRDEAFDNGPDPDGHFANNQTAVISVSYDGGNEIEILRWESDPDSTAFKSDAPNETVTIPLENPAGANALKLKFGLVDAGDDWWWAIDNLRIIAPGSGVLGDFNNDGIADVADIDLLASEIAAGGNDLLFDLNGDSLVNLGDRDLFLGGNIITSGNKLNGDADFSGTVQFPDFITLADRFGQPGTWSQGDFDADGVVQFPDFIVLANAFGKSAPAPAAVPEPGCALTLALGMLGLVAWRQRAASV